jgi:asparagine synthase (glutamine-hydrolysing)
MRGTALAMAERLRHRGPDDFGVWTDASAGAALGHRRLAIIDLSAAGAQPMLSECGRFVIAYNGEVYNFRELRRELEGAGHKFRGGSDTEVVLAAIREWGVEDALQRMNGMFAFGLWDTVSRCLTLARDRAGKKPLYYGWCGDVFLFGSELKALRAHPEFDSEIDRDALGLFLQYSRIPSPYSIFECVRKLPAGTFLEVTARGSPEDASPRSYWSAREVAERGEREPFPGSYEEATDELEALLGDAVAHRMISDVPLGALLSGGIDSTAIVALMQARSPRPVRTFSIGFREPKYNEAEFALAIARHLRTEHTELYVTAEDGMAVIPQLPALYDEPFADSSQIPTFLVSELARRDVTVALSGDGGDELFAGYERYFRCLQHWNDWRRFPHVLRRGASGALLALARESWRWLGPRDVTGEEEVAEWRRFAAKLEKRAGRLPAASIGELAARLHARCERGGDFVIGARPASCALDDPHGWADVAQPLQLMMYIDFTGFLNDDILVKVDRASMGVSLEVRCPLLDHRVVEFAWSLPIPMRVANDGGKRILRQVLERYVPRELTERPKRGFRVPIASWLRGPLRDWAEALLDENRLREQGLLRPEAVGTLWRQHLVGWRNHEVQIWSILMLQGWLDETP